MSLPHRQILKQAYGIVKLRKFLWPFGLFLLLENLLRISLILPTPPSIQLKLDSIKSSWMIVHPYWSNFLFLLLVTLIFEAVLLYFQARGGSILAVQAIVDKRETSFKKSFYLGRIFNWRLLGISVVMQSAVVILAFILFTPVLYLFAANAASRAVILEVFGVLIFITALVLANLVNLLAPMFAVIHYFKTSDALKRAFELLIMNWSTLLLFGAQLFFINLGGIVLCSAAASPFVILAVISYHRGGLLSLVIAAIILGSIVFLALQAILAIFQQTAWVLAFLHLVKPVKSEEEKTEVPVPEIV